MSTTPTSTSTTPHSPTPDDSGASRLRQLALRLPDALLARVDAHVVRMRRATPGATLSRADAIRWLLISALDAAEAKEPPAPPTGTDKSPV